MNVQQEARVKQLLEMPKPPSLEAIALAMRLPLNSVQCVAASLQRDPRKAASR